MTILKVRKKPVEVEAIEWDGSVEGATEIINWILETGDRTARYHEPQPETTLYGKVVREAVPALLHIETLEGTMVAVPGDFIIKGVSNEHYPCKPDIFENTYEKIQ